MVTLSDEKKITNIKSISMNNKTKDLKAGMSFYTGKEC